MSSLLSSKIPGVELYQVKIVISDNGIFTKPFVNDFVSDIYRDDFGEIYTIIFPPGSKRGGHYHKKSTELFCVIQGNAKLYLSKQGLTQEIEMNGKRPMAIKIPPEVTHTIENSGQENVVLVVYWNKSYSEIDNDTYKAT